MNSRKYEEIIESLFPSNQTNHIRVDINTTESNDLKIRSVIYISDRDLQQAAANAFNTFIPLRFGNTPSRPNEVEVKESLVSPGLCYIDVSFDIGLLSKTNTNFKDLKNKIEDFYKHKTTANVASSVSASSSSSSSSVSASSSSASSSAANSASATPTPARIGSAGSAFRPIARRPNLFQQDPPTSQQELRKEERQNDSPNPDSKRQKKRDDSDGSAPAP